MRFVKNLVLAGLLAAGASAAQADSTSDACINNPEQCAKAQASCAEHPEQCAGAQEKVTGAKTRASTCQDDPSACKSTAQEQMHNQIQQPGGAGSYVNSPRDRGGVVSYANNPKDRGQGAGQHGSGRR